MEIISISDNHGYLPDLPKCDIVCMCGDIVPLNIQRNEQKTYKWFCEVFVVWVNKLDCSNVIIISGNHDFFLSKSYYLFKNSKIDSGKLIYLEDDGVVLDGVSFYGTPWCPVLVNWAYYASEEDLYKKYSKIPDNVDVLLTHCPPKIGNAGVVLQKGWNEGRDFGSWELTKVLENKDIKYLFCGHIHSGDHEKTVYNNINIYNVSLKDEDYNVKYNYKKITI